ncbi:MAG TPA: hypothetical protein VM600_10195 [Actinomycetota bacterium]|nr:hypothetical protein [Actinomycetota bacterium]
MRLRATIGLVALLAVVTSAMPARAATVRILVSNYRFCIERPFPCDPLDIGYVPGPNGAPLVEQYSPITTATIRPGDRVVFVYADAACDALAALGCVGHDVQFVGGPLLPRLRAGQKDTAEFVYEGGLAVGTVLPYFCPLQGHYQSGMTGALRVGATS